MSMTRSDAATYLSAQLAAQFAAIGYDVSDPASLDAVIDDALLMTGVSASDLATAVIADATVFGFRRVLLYAGMLFVYRQAVTQVDGSISDPNVSKSRSQFATALRTALEGARGDADPFIVVDGTAAFQTGVIAFGTPTCGDEYSPYGWPGVWASCL